jgi:large subunit ribosomal protein L10
MPRTIVEARPEKTEVVSDLLERFAASPHFFLTDFSGLTVEGATTLRKNLRDTKVSFRVAKNTLIRIAAQKANVANLDEFLAGPTGIAFAPAEDPIAAAKVLAEFIKKNERPKVKAFVFEGRLYKGSELAKFAALPGKKELLAKVVGSIQAPLSGLIGTLDGVLRNFVLTLDALAKKKAG